MKKSRNFFSILILFVAVILAGCAVLKIDVDVYKGPLANHEHVQMQQMAVMAIGAKPLLIELRDQLELQHSGYEEAKVTKDGKTVRVKKKPKWMEPKFISPPSGSEEKEWPEWFTNEQAIRVNGILGLYEDMADIELMPFLEKGVAYFKDYEKNKKLASRMPGRDLEFWNKYESFFYPISKQKYGNFESVEHPLSKKWRNEFIKKQKIKDVLVEKRQKYDNEIEKIDSEIKKYKETLNKLGQSDAVDEKKVVEKTILDLENRKLELENKRKKTGKQIQSTNEEINPTKNNIIRFTNIYIDLRDGYKELHNPKEGHRKIDKIISANNKLIEFISNNKEVGGMISKDNSLSNLPEDDWDEVYNRLADPDQYGNIQSVHAEILFKGFASGKFTTKEKERFSKRTADIAKATVMSRQRLEQLFQLSLDAVVTMNRPSRTREIKNGERLTALASDIAISILRAESLRFVLGDSGRAERLPHLYITYKECGFLCDVIDSENAWKIKDCLKELFEKSPYDAATEMAKAHQFFKISENMRNYGLALVKPDDMPNEREMEATLDMILALSSGSGFDRGRLSTGLRKLIEEYLNAYDTCIESGNCDDPIGDENVKKAQKRLIDAYIRFAQKVLYVANYSTLVKSRDDIGRMKEFVYKGNGKNSPVNFKKKEINRYTLVLQAVGNSILIHADELKHRETYKKADNEIRADIEKFALNKSQKRQPSLLIELWIEELNAKARKQTAIVEKILVTMGEITKAEINTLKAAGSKNEALSSKLNEQREELQELSDSFDRLSAAYQVVFKNDAYDTSNILKEKLIKNTNINTGKKLTDEINKFISEQIKGIDQEFLQNKRPIRLKNALAFFETVKPNDNIGKLAGEPKSLLDSLGKLLKNDMTESEEHRGRVKKQLDKTEAEYAEFKSALLTATEAEKLSQKYDTAAQVIRERKSAIIAKADSSGQPTDASVVYNAVFVKLNEDKKAATEDADLATRLQYATEAMKELPPPKDQIAFDQKLEQKDLNARETLDVLIATLRHEHIYAEREGLTAQAERLSQAIKTANTYRSGLVYIRPSSSYLRSSYPATGLQEDPGVSWQNMLGRQAQRSIPFYDAALADKEQAKINTEIDKQFWQNINQVRVAGGGRTNYAVVKDDIGNWYVKRYSADTEPIVKSAQSLAMFGLGGSLDTDLVKRLRQKQDTTDSSDTAEITGESRMKKLFRKYTDDYNNNTDEIKSDLEKRLKNDDLVNQIKSAWKANTDTAKFSDELNQEIDKAEATHLDLALKTLEGSKDTKQHGRAIVSALHDVRRFHIELNQGIHRLKLTEEAKRTLDEAEATLKKSEEKLAQENATLSSLEQKRDEAKRQFNLIQSGSTDGNGLLKQAQSDYKSAEDSVTAQQAVITEQEKQVESDRQTVKERQQEYEKAQNGETFAITVAIQLTQKTLERFMARRNDSVDEYKTAVKFISESMKVEH